MLIFENLSLPIVLVDKVLDIHQWRLTFLACVAHEVMYYLITKRGRYVKRAICVEAKVGQMLGDMNRQFCKKLNRELDT